MKKTNFVIVLSRFFFPVTAFGFFLFVQAQDTFNEGLWQAQERAIIANAIRNPNGYSSSLGRDPFSESHLSAAHKKLLSPLTEDQEKHRSFLQQPKAGIFKIISLIPVSKDGGRIIATGDFGKYPVVPISGGGASYSFSKKRNVLDQWAQISLSAGYLQGVNYWENSKFWMMENIINQAVFRYYGLGVIASLGDVPIEAVQLTTKEVVPLVSFRPAQEFSAYKLQMTELEKGLLLDGIPYQAKALAEANTTYILRSVLYDRNDWLVALRVIRQEEAGSVHILWKLLQSFDTPKLKNIPKK